MFSQTDLAQFQQVGIAKEAVEAQIENFKNGFPFLDIQKAATIGDGIVQLNEQVLNNYANDYEMNPLDKVVKFVPASGAASRMFKDLFAVLNDPNQNIPDNLQSFFNRIHAFAFHNDLDAALGAGVAPDMASPHQLIEALLTDKGLNYGSLPKGLLKFHSYENGKVSRTPLEEHMVEGAKYSADKDGKVRLHFTVSPEHRAKFEQTVDTLKSQYEAKYKVQYDISYSEQKSSTDTIAVDMDNKPFRLADEKILFRPGGHGALLENLNEIDADVIFIKNIDNVVPERIQGETYRYKKALGQMIKSLQSTINSYLALLNLGGVLEEQMLDQMVDFLQNSLFVKFDRNNFSDMELCIFLKEKLNRPIRICGMVKNEGEPGGGPYWVKNEDGSSSLQILESAQINQGDPEQVKIMQGATHFNPVDLVCATKDHKGNAFNLLDFRDPKTGFIASKSKDGRELKALELPGLWNGAMADWNTVFVEVPVITFNPVKTVMDLLRPEHQPSQEAMP